MIPMIATCKRPLTILQHTAEANSSIVDLEQVKQL
jgi:hypothetical protein